MVYGADSTGPVMVLGVPPIRKSFGWRPAERIPTTFPRESSTSRAFGNESFKIQSQRRVGLIGVVPNRPREAISGYEDS